MLKIKNIKNLPDLCGLHNIFYFYTPFIVFFCIYIYIIYVYLRKTLWKYLCDPLYLVIERNTAILNNIKNFMSHLVNPHIFETSP